MAHAAERRATYAEHMALEAVLAVDDVYSDARGSILD